MNVKSKRKDFDRIDVKRSMVLALFYVVAIQSVPVNTGPEQLNQSTVGGQK